MQDDAGVESQLNQNISVARESMHFVKQYNTCIGYVQSLDWDNPLIAMTKFEPELCTANPWIAECSQTHYYQEVWQWFLFRDGASSKWLP